MRPGVKPPAHPRARGQRWQLYGRRRTLKACHKSSLSQHQMGLRPQRHEAYSLNHPKPITTPFFSHYLRPSSIFPYTIFPGCQKCGMAFWQLKAENEPRSSKKKPQPIKPERSGWLGKLQALTEPSLGCQEELLYLRTPIACVN